MPKMDGAQFLAKVVLKFPQAVRIMLTGNSDLPAAMRAVNEGNVYRFLTKPCDKDKLISTLNAALIQYRLASFKDTFYNAAVTSGPPSVPKPAKPARDLALEDASEHVHGLLAKNATTRLPATCGGIYGVKPSGSVPSMWSSAFLRPLRLRTPSNCSMQPLQWMT